MMSILFIFLNLLGWCCLIKLCRFQLYNSIIHHLYIPLIFTTQNQIFFSHHIFDLLYHLISLHSPLLLVTSIQLSVFISFSLSCLFIGRFPFYFPHMSEIIWFLTFSVWLILLPWYSQDPSMLVQMAEFIFSSHWVVFRCIYAPPFVYPITYWRSLWSFPCLGHKNYEVSLEGIDDPVTFSIDTWKTCFFFCFC